MRALLRVRFRSLFAGMAAQGKQQKKRGKGTVVLLGILYLYLLVVVCGAMAMLFWTLCEPYHMLGLDWLYFSVAGLTALGFSVLGSVFSTQSQIYDAKDNELLLAMPIPSGSILLSRMITLLLLNLLYSAIVMVPAIVVYAIKVGAAAVTIALPLLCMVAVSLLALAVACLLGWLLHLLLSKLNKSIASVLYMIVFLALYFLIYSNAGEILYSMAINGPQIADTMRRFVWPLYALGQGCLGSGWMAASFIAICCACFAAAYGILALTFRRAATMPTASGKRKKLDMRRSRVRSPREAVVFKELKKFLGCPVYFTNMGLGVIFTIALPILAVVFRAQVMEFLDLLELDSSMLALIICAVLCFLFSMSCISTPSVSLEGKNIWILKSMPVTAKQILCSKLQLHLRIVVPVNALAALVIALVFGCAPLDTLLTVILCALLGALDGVLGMVCGLRWARLDYISEAYPCKQSAAVMVSMFGMMGLPIVLGLLYGLCLHKFLRAGVFLAAVTAGVALLCLLLYRVLVTWGARKWDALS